MERDPNLARAAKLALSKYTINQNPLLKIILEAAAETIQELKEECYCPACTAERAEKAAAKQN